MLINRCIVFGSTTAATPSAAPRILLSSPRTFASGIDRSHKHVLRRSILHYTTSSSSPQSLIPIDQRQPHLTRFNNLLNAQQTRRTIMSTPREEIPQEMQCILVRDGKGPAENMYMGKERVPDVKDGEVLVKVRAFGLNRMDLLQREGKYPLPPQASKTIMGVEFSGEIVKVHETQQQGGGGGRKWNVGDAVFGLAYGGAYAEYIAVSSRMIVPKPERLSWVEAAGVPENWLTAFQALYLEGGLDPRECKGKNVLIHAGASGVGVAANQLAVHFGANKVFTTAGSDEKVKFLEKLAGGKVHAINYRTQDFEKEIKEVAPEGLDLVIDFVGPDYWNKNLGVLRQDGRMVILAFLSGAALPDKSLLGPILFKRLTIKGSTLRSRSPEYQGDLLSRFEKEALPQLGGEGAPMGVKVHEVFDWHKVVEAHKEMEANKNSGKIVFEIK